MKRKALVVASAVLSLAVAGCGGAPEEAPTASNEADQPTTPTTPSGPPRSGPAKTTDVADKCSIVTEQQRQGMGAVVPPRARESNGQSGCQYQSARAGDPGWGVFIAATGAESYQDKLAMMEEPTSTGEVDGYPTSTYGDSNGCIVYANIADHGYLIANAVYTGADDASVDLCQKAQEFAKAGIQNLPNA